MATNERSAFLRTKVARRVLGLFLLSAVIPALALSVTAFIHVRRELNDQGRTRLREMSKTTGMGILERLEFLDHQMINLTLPLRGRDSAATARLWPYVSGAARHTTGLALLVDGRSPVMTEGMQAPAPLSPEDLKHLGQGKALLRAWPLTESSANPGVFLMARVVDTTAGGLRVLWTALDRAYLLATDQDSPQLPSGMNLCVFNHARQPLGCSLPGAEDHIDLTGVGVGTSNVGTLVWEGAGTSYLAGYWNAFLGFGYGLPGWTVVVSEPTETVFHPTANFRRTFPLVVVLALLVAALLSNIQIRKSLDPLHALLEGTHRLARQDFSEPVRVESQDEFEDLAVSFNTMGRRLAAQLHALAVMNDIDRAVLSNPDRDRLIAIVLGRASGFLGCTGVVLALRHSDHDPTGWDAMTVEGDGPPSAPRPVRLRLDQIETLHGAEVLPIDRRREAPAYLGGRKKERGPAVYQVLPLRHTDDLVGILALGYADAPAWDKDDLQQARQLADQIAVAVANTRLVDQLNDLSQGALMALARTIDANSHWTAGHSERVTAGALKIAETLGLGDGEKDRLHRGGLLHDIGKIGVPAAILDKPGRLTPEERDIVNRHPETGGIILAPIAAYADVLGIVRHHHEHYDGTGYPDGLAGTEIPYLARLLAIADVYDALTSDRPYRAALSHDDAVAYIAAEAGTQFDPELVPAFLEAIGTTHAAVAGDRASFRSHG